MTKDRPYCSTGEAAKMLDLSVDTVVRLWERGELEGYRVTPRKGAHLRIYRDSVEQLDRRRKEPAHRGMCTGSIGLV